MLILINTRGNTKPLNVFFSGDKNSWSSFKRMLRMCLSRVAWSWAILSHIFFISDVNVTYIDMLYFVRTGESRIRSCSLDHLNYLRSQLRTGPVISGVATMKKPATPTTPAHLYFVHCDRISHPLTDAQCACGRPAYAVSETVNPRIYNVRHPIVWAFNKDSSLHFETQSNESHTRNRLIEFPSQL